MTLWAVCAALAGCDEPPPGESDAAPIDQQLQETAAADDVVVADVPAIDEPPVEVVEPVELRVAPADDGRTMEAWGLIAQRQYGRAEALLLDVLGEYPDTAQAEFFLGVSYQKQKDYVRARERFENVIASGVEFERDEVAYYFYGWGLYWLGELEGARAAFETFAKADPEEADAWFALGLIDYDEDKLDAAVANFTHALSLHEAMARDDPQRYRMRLQAVAKCHGRLADVYIRRDDLEAARDSLQTAIQMWPRSHQPYYKLYRVLTRLGDEEGAARALATHQRRLREQGIVEGEDG